MDPSVRERESGALSERLCQSGYENLAWRGGRHDPGRLVDGDASDVPGDLVDLTDVNADAHG